MPKKVGSTLHMPKKRVKRVNDLAKDQLAELSKKAIMTKEWQRPTSKIISLI